MVTRRRAGTLAGCLVIGAALSGFLAIPASAADPDMRFAGAAIALSVGGAVNAIVGVLMIVGRDHRGALIPLAAVALVTGLVILDGAVAVSGHLRAPLTVPALFWLAVAADVLGSLSGIAAAVLPTARPRPT